MPLTDHPPVEARQWLRSAGPHSSLATNRFGNHTRALAFVDLLYQHGATEVLVVDPGTGSEGEPYADTLLVRLPGDADARWRLQEFCEEEGPSEVPGDFTLDVFEDELRLWWD